MTGFPHFPCSEETIEASAGTEVKDGFSQIKAGKGDRVAAAQGERSDIFRQFGQQFLGVELITGRLSANVGSAAGTSTCLGCIMFTDRFMDLIGVLVHHMLLV